MTVRQGQICGEFVFLAPPPDLGALSCEITLNPHPDAHTRPGLTLGELLRTLLHSLGGHIGAPLNGLVEIGILGTKRFQVLFDLVTKDRFARHRSWPVDTDSNATEHPFSSWDSSQPQQLSCKRCDEELVVSISMNYYPRDGEPKNGDRPSRSKGCYVFSCYEIGDFLCVGVVKLRPRSQEVPYH